MMALSTFSDLAQELRERVDSDVTVAAAVVGDQQTENRLARRWNAGLTLPGMQMPLRSIWGLLSSALLTIGRRKRRGAATLLCKPLAGKLSRLCGIMPKATRF